MPDRAEKDYGLKIRNRKPGERTPALPFERRTPTVEGFGHFVPAEERHKIVMIKPIPKT